MEVFGFLKDVTMIWIKRLTYRFLYGGQGALIAQKNRATDKNVGWTSVSIHLREAHETVATTVWLSAWPCVSHKGLILEIPLSGRFI